MFAIVLQRPTKKVAGPIACAGLGVTAIEKVTRANEDKLKAIALCIFSRIFITFFGPGPEASAITIYVSSLDYHCIVLIRALVAAEFQ